VSKAVLFCPDCGHDSPVDGDWIVRTRGEGDDERAVYACPDCGTVIQTRPQFDGRTEPAPCP
jgi:predicted RNA-binding Zn-ribbon protein involved in translation (DUF1610 family)